MADDMGSKKSAAKPARAKSLKAKTPKTLKTMAPSKRAAAVEANLGGTQKLRDFLSGAGWD